MSDANYLEMALPLPTAAPGGSGTDFLIHSTHEATYDDNGDEVRIPSNHFDQIPVETRLQQPESMEPINAFDQFLEAKQRSESIENNNMFDHVLLLGAKQTRHDSNADDANEIGMAENYQQQGTLISENNSANARTDDASSSLTTVPFVYGTTSLDEFSTFGQPLAAPLKFPPPPILPAAANQVIEILDDESDGEPDNQTASAGTNDNSQRVSKRARVSVDDLSSNLGHEDELRKRAGVSEIVADAAQSSYVARAINMPTWMKRPVQPGTTVAVGSSLTGFNQHSNHLLTVATANAIEKMYKVIENSPSTFAQFDHPRYVPLPAGFVPSWKELLPPSPKPAASLLPPMVSRERKRFQLTILNLTEFTISGLPVSFEGPPTAIAGLRAAIKQISRDHGKAVYEHSSEGEGRWRIPLGAYHAFYAYLKSDPLCEVHGIPEHQLKIASLGRARLEKGYPSVEKLISLGVPKGLAKALAPFQRGGVDFVVERDGRALIADEMGLGKSIQGIASMTVYHQEWPLLVLCPSSARYHWENEFLQWLGRDSAINKPSQESSHVDDNPNGFSQEPQQDQSEPQSLPHAESRQCMELLHENQVHVLASSRDAVIPSQFTRIVICSYGLAPSLIESKRLRARMFRCAIVDESHMLKNKSTKRTSTLLPILNATDRCVLLSGTPALSKPMELWPQLKILGTERHGWWNDEKEFVDTYVRGGTTRRAELHAMLIGTVMIRRMKNDILKSMPKKVREQAIVNVSTSENRKQFHECMIQLRKGKGELGKIAREHTALEWPFPESTNGNSESSATGADVTALVAAEEALLSEYHQRLGIGRERIDHTLIATRHQLDHSQVEQMRLQMVAQLEAETRVWYIEQANFVRSQCANVKPDEKKEEKDSKGSVLNKMYSLTGDAKIPLVVDMLARWLRDPTKGKLCLFAHHISVLDALESGAGLSNQAESRTRYIRIDGSTTPKHRQEQINSFQQDPTVRIALLGITAAGVAVTLTASSTVWFAELFWTPAIMIQAEDRCHRIGQQARVHCLYFVATGTLDDILWKLIENKFRDLGEFVEGKEKLKLVIDKTYKGEKELLSIFQHGDGDEGGPSLNDIFDSLSDEGGLGDVDLDPELQFEIEELGKVEQMMLNASEIDDEDGEAPASNIEVVKKPGGTEEAAICLSDDEQDDENEERPQTNSSGNQPDGTGPALTKAVDLSANTFNTSGYLTQVSMYSMVFKGPAYGIELIVFKRRTVVVARSRERVALLGQDSKPSIGDILAAINGHRVNRVDHLHYVTSPLKSLIDRGPVELTFAEDPEFTHFFNLYRRKKAERDRQVAKIASSRVTPLSTSSQDQVIELIDDD